MPSRFCFHPIAASALAAVLLSACASTPTAKKIPYNLRPIVETAAMLAPATPAASLGPVAVSCDGERAASTELAKVFFYHDPNWSRAKEGLQAMWGGSSGLRMLETPDPLGSYVVQVATAALVAKGFGSDLQSGRKLRLTLEDIQYDELSSDTLRQGSLRVAAQVADNGGNVSYQRRFSIQISRKRGQASGAVDLAGTVIASVVGIGPSGEGVRIKEEQTVAADVFRDLFSQFGEQLIGDAALLSAIGQIPLN